MGRIDLVIRRRKSKSCGCLAGRCHLLTVQDSEYGRKATNQAYRWLHGNETLGNGALDSSAPKCAR